MTPTGLSATPAPWFSAPPAALTNVTLLDVTLPPASQLASVIFMMEGPTMLSVDLIIAMRP